MALIQYVGVGPDTSERIDGAVWGAAGPGATIRGWGSPLAAPTDQFLRLDSLARSLDILWDSLGAAYRDEWEDLGDTVGWMAGCRWFGEAGYFPISWVVVTTDDEGEEVETEAP